MRILKNNTNWGLEHIFMKSTEVNEAIQGNFIKFSEKLMGMNELTWQKHSNPWSVYTRFSVMPILSLAFWSRDWIGWYSIFPVFISFLWAWLNPRVFGIPETTNNWASMGTFGERIYLNRKSAPIPDHHVRPTNVLLMLTFLGLPIFIWGIYDLNIWALILGNVWVMAFKAWLVDRMVWLYLDMKETNPEYKNWLKS